MLSVFSHVFTLGRVCEQKFSADFFQAKLRKMKEKYGDQDEEERKLKMEILAVSFCKDKQRNSFIPFLLHFLLALQVRLF